MRKVLAWRSTSSSWDCLYLQIHNGCILCNALEFCAPPSHKPSSSHPYPLHSPSWSSLILSPSGQGVRGWVEGMIGSCSSSSDSPPDMHGTLQYSIDLICFTPWVRSFFTMFIGVREVISWIQRAWYTFRQLSWIIMAVLMMKPPGPALGKQDQP